MFGIYNSCIEVKLLLFQGVFKRIIETSHNRLIIFCTSSVIIFAIVTAYRSAVCAGIFVLFKIVFCNFANELLLSMLTHARQPNEPRKINLISCALPNNLLYDLINLIEFFIYIHRSTSIKDPCSRRRKINFETQILGSIYQCVKRIMHTRYLRGIASV